MESRRIRQWGLGFVVLVGVIAWSGCRGNEPAKLPPSIIITVPPEPLSTVLAGCETGEVESWFEVAGWLTNTFTTESRSAMRQEPGAMGPAIARLADLRDAVASQPTPECVRTTHAAILGYMHGILTHFEQYATGNLPGDEMREQVESLLDEIDTGVAQLLEQTQASLELQLRIERATQEATAAP